jgi:hypothetical protein
VLDQVIHVRVFNDAVCDDGSDEPLAEPFDEE